MSCSQVRVADRSEAEAPNPSTSLFLAGVGNLKRRSSRPSGMSKALGFRSPPADFRLCFSHLRSMRKCGFGRTLTVLPDPGSCPSGQRGQTVNLLAFSLQWFESTTPQIYKGHRQKGNFYKFKVFWRSAESLSAGRQALLPTLFQRKTVFTVFLIF